MRKVYQIRYNAEGNWIGKPVSEKEAVALNKPWVAEGKGEAFTGKRKNFIQEWYKKRKWICDCEEPENWLGAPE